MSSRHLYTAVARESTAVFWVCCRVAVGCHVVLQQLPDRRLDVQVFECEGLQLRVEGLRCASHVSHCMATAISPPTSMHVGAQWLNPVCTLAYHRSTSVDFSDESLNRWVPLRSVSQRMCFSVIQPPTSLQAQRTFAPELVVLLQLQRTIACV